MNGYFLQGQMHCPDEWWVCLGTYRESAWCIAKGIRDQPLMSFLSRPAWVPSPPLSPALLPFTIPPLNCLAKERRGADAGAHQQEAGELQPTVGPGIPART